MFALLVLIAGVVSGASAHADAGAVPEPAPTASAAGTGSGDVSGAGAPVERLVSLNPSLTSIIIALGGEQALVGIDDWSARQHPELAALPRVGGLFDPSLEAVVALRPERVLLVPSVEQRDFRERVEALGIAVEAFENISFDQVLENVQRLGRLLGKQEQARARVAAIRETRARLAAAAAERPTPRTIVVLDREPLFVAGGGTFIDEMLATFGVENPARALAGDYPQVSHEWLIAAAPGLLLDMSEDPTPPERYWARWPSLPAVANGRVLHLDARSVTLPGPYLDRSLELIAKALYGDAILAEARAR